ncbi:TIM barrel protein [Actinomycetospora sp. NBRC 106378]|uniref:TIM barrel protein n=1 Tax=Actinomycetospora sp. NBRC 106378 TaxID=3032208 RepID=UPI0024A2F26D|nr:TIM barrel protein [Actinomycetospora sp. NBRC 106378]GLZ56325.1 hydroxypyruvate isomerase [Actinomycetospora sp. NBRC 106378]
MSLGLNVSIRYPDVPVLERPARARADGFDVVESWWPFDSAGPGEPEVDAFCASITDAGVQLVAMNLFGGDMAAGERGVAGDSPAEFADSLTVGLEIGRRLGCTMHNTLVGRGPVSDAALDRLATAALTAAAQGSTLLIEPLSAVDDYPILTAADAFALVERLGAGSGVLADLYHLAVNGEDVDAAIAARGAEFAHVQIADAPGRGAPGTGSLPLARWLRSLRAVGYEGWVALENVP